MVAKQFLGAHVPVQIQAIMDMDSLKLEKESFVNEELKNSIGDVLFSVKTNDGDAYIYMLIEHQSKPDPWIAFRLYKYMINICDRYITTNPKTKKLPLIYPMIFYNGKRKYNAEKNLWNLFENPVRAKEFWAGDHKVINVHEIPDEEFQKRPWSGFMEFSMKHIRNPYLLEEWRKMAHLLPYVKMEMGRDYIRMILSYTLTAIPKDGRMELKKLVQNHLMEEEGEEIMMTAAQAIWLEGAESGAAKGLSQVAINMLSARVDPETIAKMTGLSIQEIELLRVKAKKHVLLVKKEKK